MRKFLLLAALVVSLAGCAAQRQQQTGFFIQKSTQENDLKLVNDVVRKLAAIYPPALTRFDFQNPTPDYFGTHLIASLRGNGYAVQEFATKGTTAPADLTAAGVSGIPITYVIDQVKGSDLVRVTLALNHTQSLDRIYRMKDGALYAAGLWTRKE